MTDSLKLVSIPLDSYYIDTIVDIIRKEKSASGVPLLVVLPEYFQTQDKGEFERHLDKKTGKTRALMLDKDRVVASHPATKSMLNKLVKASRENNAHIFFSGYELVGKEIVTSGFLVSPTEKEPSVAVVRRKIYSFGGFGKRSVRTVRIGNFNVLPLICSDAYDVQTTEESLKLRNVDVVALSAHRYFDRAPLLHNLRDIHEKVTRVKAVRKTAPLIIADDYHVLRDFLVKNEHEAIYLPNRKDEHEATYLPNRRSERKEHEGLVYFTHVHTK